MATVLCGVNDEAEMSVNMAASADDGAASTTTIASAPTCDQGTTTDEVEIETVAKPAYDRVTLGAA